MSASCPASAPPRSLVRVTEANAQNQHWTEAFPHLAERAATLLGVDVATVARHHKVVPGGFHVWTPGRGGAQAVLGFDGTAYVRESCFTQAQLVQAFAAGQRNDQVVAERPINHAASAVAVLLARMGGQETGTATPTGPDEAGLAALAGAPFEQTTPDEIAARLGERAAGAYAVVGVDRAHGPGHWYVAYRTEDGVQAIDPIANAVTAWPPAAADAVRWWATGTPTTPPRTVVVDVRSAHGRRVWTQTTPLLAPTAQAFLDWVATLPAEKVAKGYTVWHGFWWVVLSESGDDLRVAVTDLTADGVSTLTWDVDPMLDTYRQQREMVAFCKAGAQSTRFTETVLVYNDVYDAPEMYVERTRPVGDGASGWLVKPMAEQPRGGTVPVPAHELYRRAPHLVRYLSLPPGYRAVWAGGRTSRIWDPAGELVWDADARDRATTTPRPATAGPAPTAGPAATAGPADPADPAAPAAQAASTASTGPVTPTAAPAAPAAARGAEGSAPRPRGSAAYETARATIQDPTADAARLLAAGHGLRDAFARNEHVVGLLPHDAARIMIDAYRRADDVATRTGAPDVAREAAFAWTRQRYFREIHPAGDVVERVDRLAEDDPDGAAHVLRGWMRFKGYGYPQDAVASVRDHEVAAERGNADALFELSVLTATGQGAGPDPQRSRDYLDRAADAGHGRALYNVAAQYATGDGRPRDAARALGLYVRAGETGNARATFTAGVMTLTGEGTPPDPERAGALLRDAQDQGFDVRGAAAGFPAALAERVAAALDPA